MVRIGWSILYFLEVNIVIVAWSWSIHFFLIFDLNTHMELRFIVKCLGSKHIFPWTWILNSLVVPKISSLASSKSKFGCLCFGEGITRIVSSGIRTPFLGTLSSQSIPNLSVWKLLLSGVGVVLIGSWARSIPRFFHMEINVISSC
jgi:hypothetical protein